MNDCATKKQRKPIGFGIDIGELVKKDIEERLKIGKRKYGERLKSFNGRDALIDAYQEAIDLTLYLRQSIEERSQSLNLFSLLIDKM